VSVGIDFQPDGSVVVHVAADAVQAQQAFDHLQALLKQGAISNAHARKLMGIATDEYRRQVLYREALGA